MTELEVYLHGVLGEIKDVIMAKGASSETELFIVHTVDIAHKAFLRKVHDEIATRLEAPSGLGGVKHNE